MSLATLPYNRYSIARYYPLFNVIISKLSCRSNKSLLICNVVGLSLCFLGTKIGFCAIIANQSLLKCSLFCNKYNE